jgi:hypothetical protein
MFKPPRTLPPRSLLIPCNKAFFAASPNSFPLHTYPHTPCLGPLLRHRVVVDSDTRAVVICAGECVESRSFGGWPKIEAELHALIRRMSAENPLWGALRIHGELLKLGFEVVSPASQNTW